MIDELSLRSYTYICHFLKKYATTWLLPLNLSSIAAISEVMVESLGMVNTYATWKRGSKNFYLRASTPITVSVWLSEDI